ncbi:MAG: oligopeptide/dipeptide ABC transporter ATP-binding protein [Gammaproteobacteria bacterium]
MSALVVENLSVSFTTPDGDVSAVDALGFTVERGTTLGIVGESGSGKTQAMLALMGLLPTNGRATGSARLGGQELIGLDERALSGVRGARVAMVFQDPMTSLNPYLRIRTQMAEVLQRHRGLGRDDAVRQSIRMLDAVRIPEAANRIHDYPHTLSGGMRQRVMIAMALLCGPDVLIADEPTTALDVTVQAQVLAVLREATRAADTATILISHDLGVVAGQCDELMVMYAGRAVETGGIDAVFAAPRHPYTAGLLRSVPRLDRADEVRLATIAGEPADLQALPAGCAYAPRCERRIERCDAERPALAAGVACHVPLGSGTKGTEGA